MVKKAMGKSPSFQTRGKYYGISILILCVSTSFGATIISSPSQPLDNNTSHNLQEFLNNQSIPEVEGAYYHDNPYYTYHTTHHNISDEYNFTLVLSKEEHGPLARPAPGLLSIVPTIHAIRVEDAPKPVSYEASVSIVVAKKDVVLRLFGEGFTPNTMIKFVTEFRPRGSDCEYLPSTQTFLVDRVQSPHSVTVTIQLPTLNNSGQDFYLCVKDNGSDPSPWVHQGVERWTRIRSYQSWLPLWAHIILLVTLLLLSGLFSGLNLGLMAMDITELKIIEKTGSEKDKSYAKTVKPLRYAGNYLLCSILLGNVMFNSTLTILLDDITTGLIAVITSTLGIVIFGEIIPQAFCSRYGLAVGAHTIWITRFTMAITFPLSYPVAFILDKILGEEIGNFYNRERLKELLRVTKDHHGLATEEVGIISGALDMKTKTVKDIMVRLDSVFMLPIDAVLDFETFAFIEYQGYSRIPVYEDDRSNIVGVLNVKQLTPLDANDNIPLKTVIEYYQNQLFFVFENARLDYMFRTFREGNKGHMAFVQHINDEGEGDPFYQTIGLVTFEDVLEELLQAEIMDESDIGKHEARLAPSRCTLNDFYSFNESKIDNSKKISPTFISTATITSSSNSISGSTTTSSTPVPCEDTLIARTSSPTPSQISHQSEHIKLKKSPHQS